MQVKTAWSPRADIGAVKRASLERVHTEINHVGHCRHVGAIQRNFIVVQVERCHI